MSRKTLENTNEMCSFPSWASYNTPKIELIQYGRRIGKKVYWANKPTGSGSLNWFNSL